MAFKAGQSGNPKGRPKGTGNAALSSLRKPLNDNAEQLIQIAINMALEGNETMLRTCLDKLLPSVRSTDREISLPGLNRQASLLDKAQFVVRCVAEGKITPAEGNQVLSGLSTTARIFESDELLKRLETLEEKAREK